MTDFSVVLTEELNDILLGHLIREDGQEDLCFATYLPSTGTERTTGILHEIILPIDGERKIHGNVGFMPHYLERAIKLATERKEGLVFIHSHPGPGWQGMSEDDIVAETRLAPAIKGATNLPLLGMTAGTDGAWSARFWIKNDQQKRTYDRHWCQSVRVIGKRLSITFNDFLLPPIFDSEKQLRTISAWGERTQEDLSQLRVGIVGLGSVGSIVAEILARTGISYFTLIDFDSVEKKNLDRLTNVFEKDIGRAKVSAIRDAITRSSSSPKVTIREFDYSICEQQGFGSALDCDILFSCVDRPWPRQVLNFIAYAHLIPVIDGGILVRTNKTNTKMKGADWKAHIVGNGRVCLECLGQYKTENAKLEREGFLDDPSYIDGLENSEFVNAHENVFVFSSHLASMEVLQMLSFYIAPSGISDIGQQMHHFVTGRMGVKLGEECQENCSFKSMVSKGDFTGIEVFGRHIAAEQAREKRNSRR